MVTASRMVFGKLLASKHFPRARRFSEAVSPKLSARNPKSMKERSSSESFHGYEQVVFRESWAHPIHLQKPSREFFIFLPLLASEMAFKTFLEPATCTRKYTVSYRMKRFISEMVSNHITPYLRAAQLPLSTAAK